MRRTLVAIIVGALAAGGMSLADHDEHGKGGDHVKVLSQRDIIEKLDGKKAKATTARRWDLGQGAGNRSPEAHLTESSLHPGLEQSLAVSVSPERPPLPRMFL